MNIIGSPESIFVWFYLLNLDLCEEWVIIGVRRNNKLTNNLTITDNMLISI